MERREHPREVVTGHVELVGEERSYGARLLDLSDTGVRVQTDAALSEWGEMVLLRRVGATEDGVRCHIVRVLPDAVGVQLGLRFDRSEPDSRGRLLAMLG